MIKAFPLYRYGENHLNTFFYDGLNDFIKALLDSGVGGKLSKVPCNQVVETSILDSLGAKIEAIMDKKLSKFKLAQGSFNVSSTNKAKSFSCRIRGGTNHDLSYCGGSNSEHVATADYRGCNQDGSPIMGIISNVRRPWVMVVKIKGKLINFPRTTNLLDLLSIPTLAKETSTKATTKPIMCLIVTPRVFLTSLINILVTFGDFIIILNYF